MTALWTVVIPVKGTAMAKSRLNGTPDDRAAVALAMACDTVTAALAAEAVADVIVVTSDAVAPTFTALGAIVVADPGTSLSGAIATGIAVAVPHAADAKNVAVLLGDLPALQPRELSAALALATRHPLSMVPDAAGTGTTLLTALAGATHVPAFGAGSAAAHRASGYVPLAVAADSGLRTDVDTVHDLTALIAADRTLLGRHTREFLDVGSPSLFGL